MTAQTRLFNRVRLGVVSAVCIVRQVKNWWSPFLLYLDGSSEMAVVRFRDGDSLSVPRTHRKVLPSLCRLKDHVRARVGPREDGFLLTIQDRCRFHIPFEGGFWQLGAVWEVFDVDEYCMRNRRLDGKTVIDIGGNIGASAILFAHLGAKVHVFEPFPSTCELMARNIALSDDLGKQITIHPVGLSDITEDRDVHYDAAKNSFANALADGQAGPDLASVKLVNASTYVAALDKQGETILKIDCEGGEYRILEGTDLLRTARPAEILLEFHHGSASLGNLLESEGYRIIRWDHGDVGMMLAERAA